MFQIFILAAVAAFLFWRLKSVLGTREGFEKPVKSSPIPNTGKSRGDNVVELKADFQDEDIADYVDIESTEGKQFLEIKKVDTEFLVGEFVEGAKFAYEEILMAFELGDVKKLESMASEDVAKMFVNVIDDRANQGVSVEAVFGGVRDIKIKDVFLNKETFNAEIKVLFQCELTYSVKDSNGNIIDGNPDEIKKQRDLWTFARDLKSDSFNWILVKTE
tara:strand:+ start:334 stop:987 length:654 start_codon:yes stop_codon:yes gene_type:complete